MYIRNTEIRFLSSADVYKLSQILEPMQFWKKLMSIIPMDLNDIKADTTTDLKYKSDHIKLIECASVKDNRSCTEILLDEWGCSGKRRPTVGDLLKLLIKAELFRAADFVAINFLNEPAPDRPLKGPAAKIDISIPLPTQEIQDIECVLDEISCPGTDTLNDNRHIPSNINNQDFYVKHCENKKKVEITQSDLIKFSSSGNCENDVQNSDLLPALSALNIDNNPVDTSSLMESDSSSTDDSVSDDSFIPDVSMLQLESPNDSSLTNVTESSEENILFRNKEIVAENIPRFSALID